MRWTALVSTIVFAGCANAPAPDNPAGSARSQDRNEARALEQAEADCAKQGKHAVAKRVDGESIYDCSD
ncbi:MAG TPA: hypothetical protein VK695_00350 [Steroidobacteraceae bacterium]|jgi:hypothetical protein|nr:hypothetical protein [Steroidobacteraceae bacterium]